MLEACIPLSPSFASLRCVSSSWYSSSRTVRCDSSLIASWKLLELFVHGREDLLQLNFIDGIHLILFLCGDRSRLLIIIRNCESDYNRHCSWNIVSNKWNKLRFFVEFSSNPQRFLYNSQGKILFFFKVFWLRKSIFTDHSIYYSIYVLHNIRGDFPVSGDLPGWTNFIITFYYYVFSINMFLWVYFRVRLIIERSFSYLPWMC